MTRRLPGIFEALVLAVLAFCATAGAVGQIQMTQKEPHTLPRPDRFEIYGGYGYIHPVNSDINNYQYQPVYQLNATASLTGYFTRHLGFQVEGGYFDGPNNQVLANQCIANRLSCPYRDPSYYTVEAGPVARWQFGRVVPYIHALGGGVRIDGPGYQAFEWGWGTTGGVGVDYILPFWHNRIAVRPIQADFHYSQVTYGPLVLPQGVSGGFGEIYAYKLSGGLVARFGSMGAAPQPVMLGCPVSPASIYPGDPLTVMAQPLNLEPGRKAVYTWKTTGGKLTVNEAGASIDTAGLAPGDYTVSGHVEQSRKATRQADCQGAFTVRPFEPPTIGCTATPATLLSGGTVTITSNAISPQNRPLTYNYSASAGTITGVGSTATLATAGVPPGTINVTCGVTDDLGKSASGGTTVTIQSPPPAVVAAIAETKSLCSVSFDRDRRRPVRVDNEAKACLDDIALTLNHDPSAKLVVVGKYSADEPQIAGEERSVNVQTYLLEKGVEASRIELRVGDASGRTADSVMVPAGATYSDTATTFDSSTVHPPSYAPVRHRAVRRKKK